MLGYRKVYFFCSFLDLNHSVAIVTNKLKEESISSKSDVSGCLCGSNGITVFWRATALPSNRRLSTSLSTKYQTSIQKKILDSCTGLICLTVTLW